MCILQRLDPHDGFKDDLFLAAIGGPFFSGACAIEYWLDRRKVVSDRGERILEDANKMLDEADEVLGY